MLFPLPEMPFPTFLPSNLLRLQGQYKCCFLGDTFPDFPPPPFHHGRIPCLLLWASLGLSPCSHIPVLSLPPDLSFSGAWGKSSLSLVPSLAPDPARKSRCDTNVSQFKGILFPCADRYCWTNFHLAGCVY